MRQLPCPRGLTLIEVMVALVIGTILLGIAGPFFGDFMANSRMREGANSLLAQALYAQSEALRRGVPVRLTVTATGAQVVLVSALDTPLRSHALAQNLVVDAATIDFGASGMPAPPGSRLAVDIGHAGIACSDDLRCPGLRIDGGGSIRICANKLSCP